VSPDNPVISPVISVVIVNWNGGDLVVDCLRSLHEFPPSVAWEAILVDNASSDGSVARVRADFPGVRVIANDRNLGLAAGNNQGILASTTPFVLISNPDVHYEPGAIDALQDLLGRLPRAAFAVARLRGLDGVVQTSAGDLPSLREALLGRALARMLTPARFGRTDPRQVGRGFWWHGWDHDSEQRIGHGGEACYLVRRAAIDEIGLQDEGFVLDWEGIDWSRRAADAGWEIWYCPNATVVHTGGVSIRQVPYRWVVSSHRGMYRYFRYRIPLLARPFAAIAIAARAGVKLVAAAVDTRLYDRAH
jgi:N-acetylglucosaminyl-diphospho-decaprenol L-rhamnosyltransferase